MVIMKLCNCLLEIPANHNCNYKLKVTFISPTQNFPRNGSMGLKAP